MEISINRALSELKLLNKKISDKTKSLNVASAVTSKEVKEDAKEMFLKTIEGNIQRIRDFIDRRQRIKSAIVLSNALTKVVVAGKEMTVADAIERKQSIQLDKDLSKRMREDYFSCKNATDIHNEKASAKADKQAEAALGAATEGDKGIQYKSIYDAYYDTNKAELISIDNIEAMIETDQERIDEFESEVDFILSESNTKTMINV
ncbi:MAG: hypothetical protein ACR2MX_01600 [Cyclobacteriaceae bacterium]